jgi:membrane-bound lytic murein transglycosylase D
MLSKKLAVLVYTIASVGLGYGFISSACADEPIDLFVEQPKLKTIAIIKPALKVMQKTNVAPINPVSIANVDIKPILADNQTSTLAANTNTNTYTNIEYNSVVNIDKEDVANKYNSKVAGSLWTRIRNGFKMTNLETSMVDEKTNWYASRPEYFSRINDRANKYLYHIVTELEKRNMPLELSLLPIIESAFNPGANSSAKASGIWQFIPSTGRDFNLQQNVFVDERRDVIASTEAALDYLQRLYNMFGDWNLALAAYNWGEGSVSRAIAKNKASGLPTDYLSLNMPQETRQYVPKLQAVKNIIANPQKYSINLTDIPNHPYFITVTTNRDMDIDIAARLADMSLVDFRAMNPSFNKKLIIGSTSPQILLPWDNAEQFQKNLKDYPWPLSTITAIRLDRKENVSQIASRYGINPSEVRSINNIGKGLRFSAGSTVLLPKTGSLQNNEISAQVAERGNVRFERDTPPPAPVVLSTRENKQQDEEHAYKDTKDKKRYFINKKGQKTLLVYKEDVIKERNIKLAKLFDIEKEKEKEKENKSNKLLAREYVADKASKEDDPIKRYFTNKKGKKTLLVYKEDLIKESKKNKLTNVIVQKTEKLAKTQKVEKVEKIEKKSVIKIARLHDKTQRN